MKNKVKTCLKKIPFLSFIYRHLQTCAHASVKTSACDLKDKRTIKLIYVTISEN